VDAQRQTVQTLSDLNRTALEMTKAFDPKKYAELVTVHQELVERIAAAERRDMERDQQQTFDMTMRVYENALKAGFELVAYVPPERRSQAIASMPKSLQPVYLKVAAESADLSCSPFKPLTLENILGGKVTVTEPLLPIPPRPSAPPPSL
jgi:hypothetical protein